MVDPMRGRGVDRTGVRVDPSETWLVVKELNLDAPRRSVGHPVIIITLVRWSKILRRVIPVLSQRLFFRVGPSRAAHSPGRPRPCLPRIATLSGRTACVARSSPTATAPTGGGMTPTTRFVARSLLAFSRPALPRALRPSHPDRPRRPEPRAGPRVPDFGCRVRRHRPRRIRPAHPHPAPRA